MTLLQHQCFDQERALYGSADLTLRDCRFDGPADGESALKESRNILASRCYFNLRYPFWHDDHLTIRESEMTGLCRAALWYSNHIHISDSKLHGIKAVRECSNVTLERCDIRSAEFGWSARGIRMRGGAAESEYFLMRARDVEFSDVDFRGKYSFQYIENGVFDRCRMDTKDAFWHARHVTVRDSVLKGEYLAWYSEDLTLIRCKIIGTQPFCYCKGLRLIDCEMVDTDLCFEKSEVEATLTAPVVSIKNPRSGVIRVPSVGELILDDPDARGQVLTGRTPNGCAPCA